MTTKAKLKTAITMMADQNNAAEDVVGKLEASLSMACAFLDDQGRPPPEAARTVPAESAAA